MKNIMLLFLSDVKPFALKAPKHYELWGRSVDCIQTNESAVLYMQEFLQRKTSGEGLEKIFMISSEATRTPIRDDKDNIVDERTPLQVFEEAVLRQHPELEDHFIPIEYPQGNMDECILQVASMAERIKQECAAYEDREICLHADMTGGFRHATMMMLSIMQLLTYSEKQLSLTKQETDFHIGTILYSNLSKNPATGRFDLGEIEDATEIHRMYNLISGVDEFAKFGSVQAIQEYFGNERKKSEALENLLEAMQSFSDAIRLCRTDTILEVMRRLREKIDAFSLAGGQSVAEQLFAKIIGKIREEYSRVTEAGATELNVIEWCLAKGFWQQAMTFCTERLPLYMVDQHIVEPTDPNERTSKDQLHKYWQQEFIVTRTLARKGKPAEQVKAQQNLYKVFLSMKEKQAGKIHTDLAELGIVQDKFLLLLNEIEQADKIMLQVKKELEGIYQKAYGFGRNIYPMKTLGQHKMFSKLLKFLYYIAPGDNQEYLYFLQHNVSRETILKILLDSKEKDYVFRDEIYVLFRALSLEKEKNKAPKKKKTQEEKWQQREAYWRVAFAEKSVTTAMPGKTEEIIELLHAFDRLRNERNHINHANDEKAGTAVVDVGKVKDLVEDCLKRIHGIQNLE